MDSFRFQVLDDLFDPTNQANTRQGRRVCLEISRRDIHGVRIPHYIVHVVMWMSSIHDDKLHIFRWLPMTLSLIDEPIVDLLLI